MESMVAGAWGSRHVEFTVTKQREDEHLCSTCSLVFIQSGTPYIEQNCLCYLWPYTFLEIPSQMYLWCVSTVILNAAKLTQVSNHPSRLRTQACKRQPAATLFQCTNLLCNIFMTNASLKELRENHTFFQSFLLWCLPSIKQDEAVHGLFSPKK